MFLKYVIQQIDPITKIRDLLIEESRPIVLLGQPENISG